MSCSFTQGNGFSFCPEIAFCLLLGVQPVPTLVRVGRDNQHRYSQVEFWKSVIGEHRGGSIDNNAILANMCLWLKAMGCSFGSVEDWEDRKEFGGKNNKNKVPSMRVLIPNRSEIG